jgi:hypothetical protein
VLGIHNLNRDVSPQIHLRVNTAKALVFRDKVHLNSRYRLHFAGSSKICFESHVTKEVSHVTTPIQFFQGKYYKVQLLVMALKRDI